VTVGLGSSVILGRGRWGEGGWRPEAAPGGGNAEDTPAGVLAAVAFSGARSPGNGPGLAARPGLNGGAAVGPAPATTPPVRSWVCANVPAKASTAAPRSCGTCCSPASCRGRPTVTTPHRGAADPRCGERAPV